jgi:hypothetical protein
MPLRSLVLRNSKELWFVGGNFVVGLLFALPVKWAAAGASPNETLLFVSFATLYVITAGCFLQRGVWSEILVSVAVIGSVGIRLLDANPNFALAFPFIFLAFTSTVGIFLITLGRLERPNLFNRYVR